MLSSGARYNCLNRLDIGARCKACTFACVINRPLDKNKKKNKSLAKIAGCERTQTGHKMQWRHEHDVIALWE